MAAERKPFVGEERVGAIVVDRGPFELDAAGLAELMQELAAIGDLVGRADSYAGLRFAVDTADPAAVGRQRVGPGLGVVEQGVDAFGTPAVDQGFEVPGDIGGGAVFVGERRGGHAPTV